MTKSEMLKQWKEVSAVKSQFGKVLGERFPHACYTDPKLVTEVKNTLDGLTKKLSAVKDGTPEEKEKGEKPKKAAKKAAKGEDAEVKVGVKLGAKTTKKAAKANA